MESGHVLHMYDRGCLEGIMVGPYNGVIMYNKEVPSSIIVGLYNSVIMYNSCIISHVL